MNNKDFPTGRGIGIAFLDTGISPHGDFIKPANRLLGFKDCVGGRTKAYDDNGHGTHVAGIACGSGYMSNGRYQGVAPEALIIGVKILDKNGRGNYASAIAGLSWVMENRRRYNIRIVNMSIGIEDRLIPQMLMNAIAAVQSAGIVCVAAYGNPGSGTRNLSPDIINVVCSEDVRPGSRLPEDIFTASGHDVISCMSPDFSFHTDNRSRDKIVDKFYVRMSGSSMATPKISGLCALLLEQDPRLTPRELKEILRAAGQSYL